MLTASCCRIAASSGLRMPVSNWLFKCASVNGLDDSTPVGSTARSSCMTPAVSVPVLSLQSTSMLPKFWIAGRCFTMTCSRAMRSAPRVSVIDAIIGRNSGVSPTPRATANSSDSNGSCLSATPTSTMNSTSATVVRRISRLNRRRPCSNSVSGARVPRRTAMSPKSVLGPVATATAVPVPLTTDVPRKTRWGASGPVSPA